MYRQYIFYYIRDNNDHKHTEELNFCLTFFVTRNDCLQFLETTNNLRYFIEIWYFRTTTDYEEGFWDDNLIVSGHYSLFY